MVRRVTRCDAIMILWRSTYDACHVMYDLPTHLPIYLSIYLPSYKHGCSDANIRNHGDNNSDTASINNNTIIIIIIIIIICSADDYGACPLRRRGLPPVGRGGGGRREREHLRGRDLSRPRPLNYSHAASVFCKTEVGSRKLIPTPRLLPQDKFRNRGGVWG